MQQDINAIRPSPLRCAKYLDYKWKALAVTTVGAFMSTLDTSIIVVVLPTVLADLNVSLFLGIWIITAYRLVQSIFLVTIGRMTDIVGRVKLYDVGFAMFTGGSAICALSPSTELIVAFGIVQGLGGALFLGNSLSIIADSFLGSELGTAIGIHQIGANVRYIAGYAVSVVV